MRPSTSTSKDKMGSGGAGPPPDPQPNLQPDPNPDLQTVFKGELELIRTNLKLDGPSSTNVPEWQTFPEIPTARDLNPDWNDPEDRDRINSLLPNEWQYPWSSKNIYLETHYRLQREEAIAMLRYSIKKYRESPTMMDDEDTCVYTKVFLQGYLMTRLGPMCRIQFSTERSGKKIRWTQTRRLTTGSLVALSTASDGFETICIPAVIADHPIRDGLDQIPPTIQIFWADTDDAILDPSLELVMLESRVGYFEAVRHCMMGLQHVANTDTPLDKYLVDLDKSDLTAKHVLENPEMNMASLVHHIPDSSNMSSKTAQQRLSDVKDSKKTYNVLNGIDDELASCTNLDNSQLSAVHRILTKELAIIQGPPGTGKTYTSVQALQIFLESQRVRGSNVIIVAAQTNHAVDQILIQLIKLGFNTVRLGGRTQNEDIKHHNMFNLRRYAPRTRGEDKEFKALEAARKRHITRLEEIVACIFSDGLVDPAALRDAGIISQMQFESLMEEDDWVHSVPDLPTDMPSTPLVKWLGDQRIEVPTVNASDPKFEILESDEKVDFEAEDYDMELDDCIADDDENRGRVEGKWVPIKHQWTGANRREYAAQDLLIRKALERDDLWQIGESYRGVIYQYWQRELLRSRLAEFQAGLAAYTRICKNMKANRWLRDLQCVRRSKTEIIGCTTTGLCKYRGLLAALKPRTMLIEEAAETKEANILSALYPSIQQLILVGDHQQLAPSCDTLFLEQPPYHIRVSMFERLVKLNMPYTMLNMQRRMNPILRELLNPFYPGLQDHPAVAMPDARPPIPGMAQQSFFFHHTWNEGTDENLSKFNLLEAEMIGRFVDYLFMNGVQPSQITILTFYQGQRKKILAQCRKLQYREAFTNVHTVDSYQGEENDIVILSLVRSNGPNGPHKAGFLRDGNRGVVSISRARRGFYIFGNMINLLQACQESWEMWSRVHNVFRSQNRFGQDGRLPITCQKHGKTSWIKHPDDWINYHGGCTEPCQEKLQCGHDCGRRCHWIPHSRLICLEPCERALNCGHSCENVCGEKCSCACEVFTGAYSTDEILNSDKGLRSSKPKGIAAPSIEKNPREGKPSKTGHGLRGRRGGFARGGKSREVSTKRTNPQGPSLKTRTMLAEAWANFDAQKHDAELRKLRQEERQSMGLGTDASRSSAGNSPHTLINPITETFCQVTLTPDGRRKVHAGVVVSSSGTISPQNVDNTRRENVEATKVQDVGDLMSFDGADDDVQNEIRGDLPQLVQDLSLVGLSGNEEVTSISSLGRGSESDDHYRLEDSSDIGHPKPQPSLTSHRVAEFMRKAINRRAAKAKPEETDASTEDATGDGEEELGWDVEKGEENLIDL